jgi:hypothetical protein
MPGELVDGTDVGQSGGADDDLVTARDASADQACISALRDDGDAVVRTQPQDFRDLRCVSRPYNGNAFAFVASGEVTLIGRAQLGFDQHVPVADDAGELSNELVARARGAL